MVFFRAKSLSTRILTVAQDADKEPYFDQLLGVRISHDSGISSIVHFNLLVELAADMQGFAPLLFIPADVFVELGVHELDVSGKTTFLQIFRLEERFVDATFLKLFLNVIKVRNLSSGKLNRLLKIH